MPDKPFIERVRYYNNNFVPSTKTGMKRFVWAVNLIFLIPSKVKTIHTNTQYCISHKFNQFSTSSHLPRPAVSLWLTIFCTLRVLRLLLIYHFFASENLTILQHSSWNFAAWSQLQTQTSLTSFICFNEINAKPCKANRNGRSYKNVFLTQVHFFSKVNNAVYTFNLWFCTSKFKQARSPLIWHIILKDHQYRLLNVMFTRKHSVK